MKTRTLILIAPVLVGLFLLSGCGGSEEMSPLHTFTSGSYQVEVLTPGGILESGDNAIAVRVLENNQPVDIQEGQLMFSMPQMGNMPYMEMHAQFARREDGAGLDGKIKFNMGGSWNGQMQVITANGPVSGTFQVHVEE